MAEPEFDLTHAGTALIFVFGAFILLWFSGYVLLGAAKHGERRKQVPSYLMIGRTVADSVFAIIFYVDVLLSRFNIAYIENDEHCNRWSMFFVWCFLVSCGYFGAICIDIYHTLLNPFNRPISNSFLTHLLCWLFSLIFVGIFSLPHNIAWGYRPDYQVCFIKWTDDVNPYNIILLYLPIIGINMIGLGVSYWSLKQLQVKILDATFECRWIILRRQLFITLCYTFSYVIAFCFWLPIVIYAFIVDEKPTHGTFQPYFVLFIVISQLLGDALAWYYSNYFSTAGSTRKIKILRFFGLLGEQVAYHIGIEINASQSDLGMGNGVASNEASISHDKYDKVDHGNSNQLKEQLVIKEASQQNENEILRKLTMEETKLENKSKTQDLSDALRREVVAYMTHGVSKSLMNTLNETKNFVNNTQNVLQGSNADLIDEDENMEEPQPRGDILYSDTLDFDINVDVNTGFSIVNQYSTEFGNDNDNVSLSNNKNNLQNKEKNLFVDYSPHMFRYLRSNVYKLNEYSYYESISSCYKDNLNNHIKSHFSEGASGAFFFFTIDQKYIIKTVTEDEAQLLLDILPRYVNYLSKCENESYLNKFYGLYCLQYYKKIYFVVINNLLVPNEKPQETYDIKGSWVDRHTKYHVESGKLMKDTDLHKKLSLDYNTAHRAYHQLFDDTKFLASVGIMDYSLLLGIYYMKVDSSYINDNRHSSAAGGNDEKDSKSQEIDDDDGKIEYPEELEMIVKAAEKQDNITQKLKRPKSYSYHKGMQRVGHHPGAIQARKLEGPCVYYFGIIDMLQAWNRDKKLERFFKVWLLCKEKKGVSCVEPNFYQLRFMKRMCDLNIRPYPSQQM